MSVQARVWIIDGGNVDGIDSDTQGPSISAYLSACLSIVLLEEISKLKACISKWCVCFLPTCVNHYYFCSWSWNQTLCQLPWHAITSQEEGSGFETILLPQWLCYT